MAKLYLRDVGSYPERDLEVTIFPDGELQFEADNGKYVHINIAREGVSELVDFLMKEIMKEIRRKQREVNGAKCPEHGKPVSNAVHFECGCEYPRAFFARH